MRRETRRARSGAASRSLEAATAPPAAFAGRPRWRSAWAGVLARVVLVELVVLAQGAAADEGERARAAPAPPAYRQECAACHVAYPPGLLPPASWQRLMSTLPRHFGVDASLDAATTAELSAWLQAHGATGKRASQAPPDDRITRSAWFVRQHDELPSAVWSRPAVKSASNCAACHTRADLGDFDERTVRIPR